MKKLYSLLFLLLPLFMFSQTTDLIISKYGEGSSNHKFLEIYNGTGSDIDLSTYAFPNSNNDPDTVGEYDYWNSFTAGAVIAAGDVYVLADEDVDATVLAEMDQEHNYLSNGDDGFKLVKDFTWNDADSDGSIDEGEATGYTVVDVLGDWQGDPGSGWDVAGVNNATKDHTLTRKTSVCSGNTDWASSAGTTTEDSEWVVTGQNEGWDTVGSYTTACTSGGGGGGTTCDWSVVLTDSYGDGWNGNSIDVLVNSTVVLDDVTVSSTQGTTATYTFAVATGDTVEVVWNATGSYGYETSYEVFDSENNSMATGAEADASATGACPEPSCTYSIVLTDSYGDGWNGNSVDVLVDATVVLDDVTVSSTQGTTATFDIPVSNGSSIEVVWNATGSYGYETSYEVFDSGATVVASGAETDATATAVCSASPSADWDVSVSGADATVSISVENFTVESGGSHWHYTLDGGSDVMVYDTNDVALTGLANGDHTLVAWLVDSSHAALDPAVEETIAFSTFDGVYGGTYPYCSSFDADLDNWTAESVSGDTNWSSGSANQNSSVTPLSGAGMAYLYDNSSEANLISPSMDLTGVSNPQVTFNHTQVDWVGDQDELRVWYKAASGDAWTELAAYTAEVAAWTEVTLDLPNPSATYYIAFNGTAAYGRGITVDDVCVHEGPGDPNTVLADPTLGWVGYMNVFDLTAGAQGGYLWGSAWGVDALATTLNTDTDYMTITLEPNYNTYADNPGDAYWQDGSGGGAKWMEASTYVESASEWNNADLTFTGYVYHHSLAADWTANVFIKALDPNNGYTDALAGAYVTALPSDGVFSVTVPSSELSAGYIVQAGFSVNGPNANPDNQTANGKVILGGDADAPMSINDVNVLDMRIYPNPVDGNYVTILSPVNGVKYVEVFDINGRRVMDTAINNNTLDVSSINSGFYMIKVTIDGQSKISKLVIR